jgi:hypothetical protein
MGIFYKKGIKYFSIVTLTITILKYLRIGSDMTEKEAVYLMTQSKENFFEFTYEPYQKYLAIIIVSFSIWLFLFYLDSIQIRPMIRRKR